MFDVLFYHSAVGNLKIEFSEGAIIGAWFVDSMENTIEPQAGVKNDNIHNAALDWLKTYFDGDFDRLTSLPLKFSKKKTSDFAETVLMYLEKSTKPGQLTSYKSLSLTLFNCEKYARSIGNVMRNNPIVLFIPCHRVVPHISISNSQFNLGIAGAAGKYMGGKGNGIKEKLLRHESTFASRGQCCNFVVKDL